ncbi:MAG: response regulator transcription factor [Anaerovoracaceae bacterium]
MRILIVEDDKNMQRLLEKRLKEESYSVDSCNNGEEALDFAQMVQYDCILLDLMIPRVDGIEVLKRLRKNGNSSYILIMTAKDSVEDRVRGLDAGADDYLVKPFALDELLARIRALVRRQNDNKTTELKLDDLTVDTVAHTAKRGEETIFLTSKEYALLEYLMRNQGKVLTRTQINDNVWDYSYYTESNIVDVYIRYLRNKIDANHKNKLIQTVRGFGYVMRLEDGKGK